MRYFDPTQVWKLRETNNKESTLHLLLFPSSSEPTLSCFFTRGFILWQQLDFDATIDPNLRENTNLNPPGAAGSLVYVVLKACVCL